MKIIYNVGPLDALGPLTIINVGENIEYHFIYRSSLSTQLVIKFCGLNFSYLNNYNLPFQTLQTSVFVSFSSKACIIYAVPI